MNKKTYYKLLQAYSTMVEKKEYNNMYVETEHFNNIKEKLCSYLSLLCRRSDAISMNYAYSRNYAQAAIYEVCSRKITVLINKISAGEPVTKEDYENTYLVEKYFGFLTKNQLIIILAGAIVMLCLVLLH